MSDNPEIRKDYLTGDWVLLAPGRGKRPHDFSEESPSENLPEYDPRCPFCPGGIADRTQPSIYEVRDENGQWVLRSILNKYPALKPEVRFDIRLTEEGYKYRTGYGFHEVIIESNKHNVPLNFPDAPKAHVERVLAAYLERFKHYRENGKNIRMVIIFKNYGPLAGASLIHPHSQLIATPVVGGHYRKIWDNMRTWQDENGTCLICWMINREMLSGTRIIYKNEHFIAFAPFASSVAYQVMIAPLEHSCSFAKLKKQRISHLADIVGKVLGAIKKALGNPSFNLVIKSPPFDEEDFFAHWYMEILPRTAHFAGFELGSRMSINTVLPEEAAELLRENLP